MLLCRLMICYNFGCTHIQADFTKFKVGIVMLRVLMSLINKPCEKQTPKIDNLKTKLYNDKHESKISINFQEHVNFSFTFSFLISLSILSRAKAKFDWPTLLKLLTYKVNALRNLCRQNNF